MMWVNGVCVCVWCVGSAVNPIIAGHILMGCDSLYGDCNNGVDHMLSSFI